MNDRDRAAAAVVVVIRRGVMTLKNNIVEEAFQFASVVLQRDGRKRYEGGMCISPCMHPCTIFHSFKETLNFKKEIYMHPDDKF